MILKIEEFLGSNRDFKEYQQNKMKKMAVERCLEIIGEAINRALKQDSSLSISNARKIIETRNFVIHAYDSIDDNIIWGIVNRHLPLLKKEIEILLKNLEKTDITN